MEKGRQSRFREIESVKEGSIGEEAGIEKGDVLLAINGSEIKDILDYIYLTNDEFLFLEIEKRDGEIWEIEIEKSYDEELGLVFHTPTLDRIIRCQNNCMFCFVDQMPEGMRSSLYVKDDDYRLSALHGNFVTLTNMREEDLDRILKFRITPINVSVHTTNPELRIKMMGNKNAGNVMEHIKRLADCHISINAQIVLCPGLNDGMELEKTINDLSGFFPSIQSVAIVPVGRTKFREGLHHLDIFDKESARATIELVKKAQSVLRERFGTSFVHLSDEFFIIADSGFPEYDDYEGFPQIEDGVGLVRKFERQILDAASELKSDAGVDLRIAIVTGKLAFGFMNEMASIIENHFRGLAINVVMVENEYFGEDITVAGLLCGKDLIRSVAGIEEDVVLIPGVMIKEGTNLTVDDFDFEEIGRRFGKEIIPVAVDGHLLIEKIIELRNRS